MKYPEQKSATETCETRKKIGDYVKREEPTWTKRIKTHIRSTKNRNWREIKMKTVSIDIENREKHSQVWRHSDIVVASVNSFLQTGHVMHAASFSLPTFNTCPVLTIIVFFFFFFFFLNQLRVSIKHCPTHKITNTFSRTPHDACHQYTEIQTIVCHSERETTSPRKSGT